MNEAIEKEVIAQRFTFHDLRAYYAKQYKLERGDLPRPSRESRDDRAGLRPKQNREATGHVIPKMGITKQKRHWI